SWPRDWSSDVCSSDLVLTMLGMAWGIATVVLLLAYGDGFGRAIQNIFQSFGARAVGVFPGRTSQQAGGNKAGVQVRFTNEDIERSEERRVGKEEGSER